MDGGKALPTIMVVDDEPQVLTAISDTLEDEFHLLLELSPESAIAALQHEKECAVIISDQRMPGLSGHEFLGRAREFSDATRVLITGYSDIEAVIAAVNAGRIFGFVSKPWDPVKLRQLAHQAVAHCQLTRALNEERRLLHNLLDNVPDEIYFKDSERRYLRSNRAHASSLGVSDPAAIIGKRIEDLLPRHEADVIDASDASVLASGEPTTDAPIRLERATGAQVWISTTRAAMRDERGRITGVIGIGRDVTDSKLKGDQIRLSLKEKEVLLGEVHHRVRNNLQIVQSLLALQSQKIADPTVRESLRAAGIRVEAMALIHNTLYDSGDFAEVDFAGFLKVLTAALSSTYGVDPDRLTLSVDAAGVRLPIGSAFPCGLLVSELITNAVKHAFPHGRKGAINVAIAATGDDEIALSVSDDGIGIPEDLNLEKTATLGLHLFNMLAGQLGATRTIERANPTRFVLRFPVER